MKENWPNNSSCEKDLGSQINVKLNMSQYCGSADQKKVIYSATQVYYL